MTHPEWAAAGNEVAVYRRTYDGPLAERVRVARHTRTQVVLETGDRYRLYEPYGRYIEVGGYGNCILPLSNPDVLLAFRTDQIKAEIASLRRLAYVLSVNDLGSGIEACRTSLNRIEALLDT